MRSKNSRHGDVEIVDPVHLNPNVQEPFNRILKGTPHVTLLPPLDYLPMVHLMKHAKLISCTTPADYRRRRPRWASRFLSCEKPPSARKGSTPGRSNLSARRSTGSSVKRMVSWMIRSRTLKWQSGKPIRRWSAARTGRSTILDRAA